MEQELNKLNQQIAETVNEMIPEEWEKFHFYAQISESGGGTYFFYKTLDDLKDYQYSLEIPFKYIMDKEEFKNNKRKLFKLSDELRGVFVENNQELWYSFTMTLKNDGSFKLHFDYTDWFDTEYSFSDQMLIWKYKYLNEVPNDEKHKKMIEKYYSEFSSDPI